MVDARYGKVRQECTAAGGKDDLVVQGIVRGIVLVWAIGVHSLAVADVLRPGVNLSDFVRLNAAICALPRRTKISAIKSRRFERKVHHFMRMKITIPRASPLHCSAQIQRPRWYSFSTPHCPFSAASPPVS